MDSLLLTGFIVGYLYQASFALICEDSQSWVTKRSDCKECTCAEAVSTRSVDYVTNLCKKDGPGVGSKMSARQACCKTCTDLGYPPDSSGEMVDQLMTELNVTKQSVEELRKELQEVKAAVLTKAPAFMVQLKSSINPEPGSVIRLKKGTSNEGQHYNPRTGKYSCPKDGWYMFAYSVSGRGLRKSRHRRISAELVKDETVVNSIEENNYMDGDGWMNLQGSNMAYVHCSFGQMVWLKTNSHMTGSRLDTATFVGLWIRG